MADREHLGLSEEESEGKGSQVQCRGESADEAVLEVDGSSTPKY